MRAKFIYENLNFTRNDKDSLASYGVGQVHLIKSWLDQFKIINYIINDDFTIDVNGYVYLSNKNLTKLPDYIKFNKVAGSFACDSNQLTSLEGCPTLVGGNFYCYNNRVNFSEKDVRKLCDVKTGIML